MLVALVDDLMFLSRIREAARGSGADVLSVRGGEALIAAARAGARLVLVDADSTRIAWQGALEALRALPEFAALPVVAFVSHANAAQAEAARAAGATRVLARSAFIQELPHLVADPRPAQHETGS